MFLSFLCNTQSAKGKGNEETYCEAAKGSHGEIVCTEISWLAVSEMRSSYQNPSAAKYPCHYLTMYEVRKRIAGCERRRHRGGVVLLQPQVKDSFSKLGLHFVI